MPEIALVVLIGLLGGVAAGVQTPLVGAMSVRVGGMASSLVVHAGGAALSGALLLLRGGVPLQQWRSLPWYMIVSGVKIELLLYSFCWNDSMNISREEGFKCTCII